MSVVGRNDLSVRINAGDSESGTIPQPDAPEKALTHFAMRLALLEKIATGLGTLGFIWATVVLLGGFAATLDTTDFWFITIILVIEGARIFSRSHELEWQHQATWDNAYAITPSGNLIQPVQPLSSSPRDNADAITPSSESVQQKGQCSSTTGAKAEAMVSSSCKQNQDEATTSSTTRDEENQLPPVQPQASTSFVKNIGKFWDRMKLQASMFFVAKNICNIWYLLQLLSAVACVILSLIKLIMHNFGHVEKGDTDKKNRQAALFIFYSLVLAEASFFIIEKAYWEVTIRVHKLLEKVNNEYVLEEEGMISTRRFFYDAYSRSIKGSIFDSLRMDMVSFAVELLNSNSPNEQLLGATLLLRLSTSNTYSSVILRKIGVDKCVIERLVEMLNWRNPCEQEIRKSAAAILEQVASQNQNSLRIAEIPGAVESVASLLHSARPSYTSAGDEIIQRGKINEQGHEHVQETNTGLRILNNLSRDHDNCAKIGNTRGLLPKIIDFTYTTEDMLRNSEVPNGHITTVSQSLELVKMLVSSTGQTGANLRREMSEIVFTISNVRNILKNGEQYPMMQLRGIQVLTKLGLEDDATENIGGTGGVLKELMNIFLTNTKQELRNAAGDAIAMLTLECKKNCYSVLQLGETPKKNLANLLRALKEEALCINAARILRNLCIYTNTKDEPINNMLFRVVETAPTVLEGITKPVSTKQQEVMTGLALPVFKYYLHKHFEDVLKIKGHSGYDLAAALVKILEDHRTPSIEVPRIRRFAIELAIWMMKEWKENIDNFRNLKIEKELKEVIETTTDIENFHLFSGTVGVSRCDNSVKSLAHEALSLILGA